MKQINESLVGRTQELRALSDSLREKDETKWLIRILLVDDQELVRHGLRHMLEPEEEMEVVGDCASAEEAFSRLRMVYPDMVVMDTHMPGMDGIEATRNLKRSGA